MTTGILLTAFGGPESPNEVASFVERLTGRVPSPEVLDEVLLRYLTIGGASPLPGIAQRTASSLKDQIAAAGHPVPVAVGMRYSPPFISEAFAGLVAEGVDRVVTASLSAFESEKSSGAYRQAVQEAHAQAPEVAVAEADPIHETPEFVGAMSASIGDAVRELVSNAPREKCCAVFTAHSVPQEEAGSREYVRQLQETVTRIAAESSLEEPAAAGQTWLKGISGFGTGRTNDVPWLLAYQSKGRGAGEWIGPMADEVIDAIAAAGFRGVAVCPVGFVTEHLETLYDIDVELAERALDRDLEFSRGRAPNDHPLIIDALMRVITPLL